MWNDSKSLLLSSVCTKLLIVLWLVFAFAAPYVLRWYLILSGKPTDNILPLLITVYLTYVPILLAVLCLNKLLKNIGKDAVFVGENVKCLRLISWCCFLVAIIFLLAGAYYLLFWLLAFVAAFLGLVMRVVKNVFAEAIAIKLENDYTI